MKFTKTQLQQAIQSETEIVAIWGAFQILKLEEETIREFLPFFLSSPFEDIKDVGIAKIAEFEDAEYAADITRIFRLSEGQLKFTAAFALSKFPNDFTASLIHKWFEQLIESEQSTRVEFEAATYAYINVDRKRNFKEAVNLLVSSQSDVIKSSVLFSNLLHYCETKEEHIDLINQYFIIRDNFSDAELTLNLVGAFIYEELGEWWMANLTKGYSISSIFEQCYVLLGMEDNITDRNYWVEIEQAIGDAKVHKSCPDNPKQFVETLQAWISQLLDSPVENKNLKSFEWILESFCFNEAIIPNTIPKILELETRFLLSIPLQIILDRSFKSWLSNPVEHIEQIANYYHSTLLINDYREQILSLFFPETPLWTDEQMTIVSDATPVKANDNKNDIIWSFYRGELLGYNVSWPTIFPNPDCSIHLAEGLANIYSVNFGRFIKSNDKVSIDYSLQLFQLKPTDKSLELILEHFEYLHQHHTDTLYQTIEYVPDKRFMEQLIGRYEGGEQELARLILLISEIFSLEIPEEILVDIEKMKASGFQIAANKKPVRLTCHSCHSTFQYGVDMIYIDEGSIIRANKLSQESVWVPQTFNCKKCNSEIKFIMDEAQLEELSQQSRVDRILKITPQSNDHHFGFQTCLIDFPRFNGKTYKPQEFFQFMEKIEEDKKLGKEDLKILWMKLARLQKDLSLWEQCKASLEQVKSLEKIDEEWMYLMGFVSMKLSLFADARKYFDWIVKKHPEEMPYESYAPYVEKSRYFIGLLDSKTEKRARFKLITGKK